MSGREYLLKIKDLNHIVKTYEEEYEVLMARLTSISYKTKEINVMVSKEDKMPENIDKLINLKRKYEVNLTEYATLKLKAENLVREIRDFRLQAILIKYYFQGKTLEQIAVDMDMSYRWICELRDDAVAEFEKIFEKLRFTS